MNDWRVYYPDDNETGDEAVEVKPYDWEKIHDAEHAAEIACRNDFERRDGWERGHAEFNIVIIDKDGVETKWVCAHEPSVRHAARRKEDV